jgi:cyclophilin family peptidyl-prolyl cis-trans isomerase
LELQPTNVRAWQQLGQIQQELGNHEDAIVSFEEAIARDERGQLQTWQVLYIMAISHRDLGDDANAIAKARQSLEQSPEEYRPQIQQFIADLTGEEVSLPPAPAETGVQLNGERPLAAIAPADRVNIYNAYPPMVIDPSKQYEAIITTDNGEIRLELLPEAAPLAVNSFVFLATQGYFDDITFHRVLQGFMAQGGDPSGTGGGGPGYQFANETDSGLSFDKAGVLAMANAGPDTNGGQFFITFGPAPQLDGGYTIFGQLIDGEEVLNSITFRDPTQSPDFEGDRIQRIDIVEK